MTLVIHSSHNSTLIEFRCDSDNCENRADDLLGIGRADLEQDNYGASNAAYNSIAAVIERMARRAQQIGWKIQSTPTNHRQTDLCRAHNPSALIHTHTPDTPDTPDPWLLRTYNITPNPPKTYSPPIDT